MKYAAADPTTAPPQITTSNDKLIAGVFHDIVPPASG
jgi:hypothetical protein